MQRWDMQWDRQAFACMHDVVVTLPCVHGEQSRLLSINCCYTTHKWPYPMGKTVA